jgi:hypothetical protein
MDVVVVAVEVAVRVMVAAVADADTAVVPIGRMVVLELMLA